MVLIQSIPGGAAPPGGANTPGGANAEYTSIADDMVLIQSLCGSDPGQGLPRGLHLPGGGPGGLHL